MRGNHVVLGFAVGAAIGFLSPRSFACGGTFCDRGLTMPVDQKGENILFVVDGGHVEAHIQIQYQGDPAKFAWVLPLPTVPDSIAVGSQPLFANLLAATVPQYGTSVCRAVTNGGGGGAVLGVPTGNVQVELHEAVGAFDVVVLSGGSGSEVSSWLANNGYAALPAAPAILDDYVSQGFVFAAVKLTGGAGLDEIHPLVVRYKDRGEGACVPLKLTAVAATPDMGVRAFFLDAGRVVPSNYEHVIPNPARFDWVRFADNYQEVVARAVDEAGGHAFVTEFAGPSAAVTRNGVYDMRWDPSRFVSLAPESVIDELIRQGLAQCGGGTCQMTNPLLLGLLRQYLPAPSGVDELGFYSCLACYRGQMDTSKWDGAMFGKDLLERIVTPGHHANDLLDRYAYLTRLYTEISPEEMTVDPLFVKRPDLGAVSTNQIASMSCGGGGNVKLPDGTEVRLDDKGAWPKFGDDMPWALKVVEYSDTGETLIADNQSTIQKGVAAWNATRPDPSAMPIGSFPAQPPITLPTSMPSNLPPSPPPPSVSSIHRQPSADESSGCGCRVHSAAPRMGAAWLAAALFLVAGIRRRRPSASRSRA